MRALANDGQPRFRLPCAEVLLPSCASPVAAPRLRRQILVLLFGALPDVSVRLVSRIPVGSVPPVGLLQCLCQTIDSVRDRGQVDMVRHEAISNEGDAVEDDVLA
jgi:hypothetical protein